MAFDETHAKKLPLFGIRDLYGPSSRPGIVQISAPQYDSTIRSYPDAILTYHDDDDGETITVGSGFELEQRLDEPVRPRRRLLAGSSSPSRPGSFDDRLVHLFDIQQSPNSYVVWKEHEAYSSKTLRWSSTSSVSSNVGEPGACHNQQVVYAGAAPPSTSEIVAYPGLPVHQETLALSSGHVPVRTDPTSPPDLNTRPVPQPGISAAPRTDPTTDPLRDFLEMNVGTFADFLDSTAQVLRTVAQKTREADASPVESFLAGMKDVLSEVGRLGMEVLNGLEYESIPSQKSQESQPQLQEGDVRRGPEEDIPKTVAPTADSFALQDYHTQLMLLEEQNMKRIMMAHQKKVQEQGHTEPKSDIPAMTKPAPILGKRVSFANIKSGVSEDTIANHTQKPEVLTNIRNLDKDVEAQRQTATGPTQNRPAPVPPSAPHPSFPNRPGSIVMPARNPPQLSTSIMDLETSHPEFAARYPPLISLRRAKTISDLQKNKQGSQETMTTKAALTRYPSIGQLELQRRPLQTQYMRRGKTAEVSSRTEGEDPLEALISPVSPMRKDDSPPAQSRSRGYKSPSVEDERTAIVNTCRERSFPIARALAEPGDGSAPKTLPGSWPESKQEDMSALPIANESSGAFFNRMTGITQLESKPARPVSPALSCRNTSPPADPFWPSTNLRRANTVTASNPAARLTRPFDPMSSAPNPLFPRPGDALPSNTPNLMGLGPPRRSLTQYNPSRTAAQLSTSSVGEPSVWGNYPRRSQVPMAQLRPQVGPWPQVQSQPHQSGLPFLAPNANSFEDFVKQCQHPRDNPAHPQNATWNGPTGTFPSLPTAASKVNECVKTLRNMGYGSNDPNEDARLNVYAGASAGDVIEAVDMIEEDRQVAATMAAGPIRTL